MSGLSQSRKGQARLRCLELVGLPDERRGKDWIRGWMSAKYPWVRVEEVILTFNTHRLWKLVRQETDLIRTLAECSQGETALCCRMTQRQVSVEEFYKKKLAETREKILHESIMCLEAPMDTAFVILAREKDAADVVTFEDTVGVKTNDFRVSLATEVEDIQWQNFQSPDWLFWKRVVVNLLLFLITWGLTTPEHIAQVLIWIFPTSKVQSETARIYLLVLILNLSSKTCAWLMNIGIEFLGYWKKSTINHTIFMELTAYILVTILLLPTLGFITIYHFLEFLVRLVSATISLDEMSQSVTPQWFCIFLPQGGRFYATYMMTTALTGNVLSLFRLKDKVAFLGRVFGARSLAEVRARFNQLGPTSHTCWFGEEYAQLMLHLYITVCLMTAFPILAPIGLLYFVVKHLVDLFSFKQSCLHPTKINMDHVASSISFTVGSSVALQFYNFLYIVNNSIHLEVTSEIVGFVAIASLTFLFIQMASGWTWPLALIPKEEDLLDKTWCDDHQEDMSTSAARESFWPPYLVKLPLMIRWNNSVV